GGGLPAAPHAPDAGARLDGPRRLRGRHHPHPDRAREGEPRHLRSLGDLPRLEERARREPAAARGGAGASGPGTSGRRDRRRESPAASAAGPAGARAADDLVGRDHRPRAGRLDPVAHRQARAGGQRTAADRGALAHRARPARRAPARRRADAGRGRRPGGRRRAGDGRFTTGSHGLVSQRWVMRALLVLTLAGGSVAHTTLTPLVSIAGVTPDLPLIMVALL